MKCGSTLLIAVLGLGLLLIRPQPLPAQSADGAAPAALPAGDPARGEKLWKKCRSCHEIGPGATNKVGPPLNDLFGRVVGTSPDFIYSKAMIQAGKDGMVWTDETLDRFLTRPKSFIRSTRMSFAGLKKPRDRADLIAFMKQYSGGATGDGTGNAAGNAAGDGRLVRPEDPHLTARDPELPAELLEIEGDPAYGEYLAGTCVGCHQASGADKGIPSITGWPRKAFMTAMFAYREKFRDNPVMQQIAGSLNNEEIAALAAYFETQ